MAVWPQSLLAEVANFQEGPGILAKDFRDSGIPLVRLSGLGRYEVTLDGCNYVSEKLGTTKWNHFRLNKGDILISTSASFGRPAVVGDEATGAIFYTGIIRFRSSSPRLDEAYLKLFLGSRAFSLQANAVASGSVIQHYGPSHLKRMTIDLPPINVQVQIASIISALDNKIELNRRMNETLEASARALFRDWFVDFGPTCAKAEGRPAYLAPDLWSLFPDRLGDDGVAEGWKMARLKDHAIVTKGRSYSSAELAPSSTALVTLKSFERGGGYRRDGLKPYTGTFKDNQVVGEGEVVISQTDVTQAAELIGRPARVMPDLRFERLVASLDVGILRPNSQTYLDRNFLFSLTATPEFTQHALAHSTGTTVLHLAANAIPNFAFVLPSAGLVAAHRKLIVPFFERVAQNVRESDDLAATRDALLPKLMSGELRVRDAEDLAA